jgi:hypothetical protein
MKGLMVDLLVIMNFRLEVIDCPTTIDKARSVSPMARELSVRCYWFPKKGELQNLPNFNPFIFTRNKRLLSSESFSALGKNAVICT